MRYLAALLLIVSACASSHVPYREIELTRCEPGAKGILIVDENGRFIDFQCVKERSLTRRDYERWTNTPYRFDKEI